MVVLVKFFSCARRQRSAPKHSTPKAEALNSPTPAPTAVSGAAAPPSSGSKKKAPPAAVLRLVKLREYVAAARSGEGSLCYDFLDSSLFVDAPFTELMATVKNDTAVVSWRWPFRKPGTEDGWKSKFSAADEAAGRAQQLPADLLDTIASSEHAWLWLDWACVPQYGRGDTMKAIELSGIVYREAASMIMWEANALPGFRIGREYMSRAWTLAERMQRRARQLRLRDFLSVARLEALGALQRKFEAAVQGQSPAGELTAADWQLLLAELHAALYGLVSSAPPGTEETAVEHADFLQRAPLEVVGLCSANLYEATAFHLIDQLRVMGPYTAPTLMAELRAIKNQYEGYNSTGGLDGATYVKLCAAGVQLEELTAHEVQSDQWWKMLAINAHKLLMRVLECQLFEGAHAGWLIDYLCRSSAVEYHAWSRHDLLLCLLASGAVADKALDARAPMRGYPDVLTRVLALVRLEGIESQLTLLMIKPDASDGVPQQLPTWHPARFFGSLDLPEEVYTKWANPKSLSAFLEQTQTMVRRFGCRANMAVFSVHASANRLVCGQAVLQDVDAVLHFSSWWPAGLQPSMVSWYQERIGKFTGEVAQKDWTKGPSRVDPSPEVAQHEVQTDGNADEPGMIAMRLTLFPPQDGKWFSGAVDAGQIANDLRVDLVWKLDGQGAWKLATRKAGLVFAEVSIVTGNELKGVDAKDFDPVGVVKASLAESKQKASLLNAPLA